jgi:hypothetical protein
LGGRGRWISEFEASLVYKVSSRAARATQRNLVSEENKTNKKEITTETKRELGGQIEKHACTGSGRECGLRRRWGHCFWGIDCEGRSAWCFLCLHDLAAFHLDIRLLSLHWQNQAFESLKQQSPLPSNLRSD